MISNNKKIFKKYSDDLLIMSQENITKRIYEFFDEKAVINVVDPINKIYGSEGFIDCFFLPILNAFPDLYRRTDILFGGIFEDLDLVRIFCIWCFNIYYNQISCPIFPNF